MTFNTEIEIERKYIIYKPDIDALSHTDFFRAYNITQTYLSAPRGVTRRVRKKEDRGEVVYIETEKRRIDGMSSYESERYIDEEEYDKLLSDRLAGSRDIVKMRYVFFYKNQKYEIDVYPEWREFCIMETELESRDILAEIPPFIKVYSDVTGLREYSNAQMSLSFPKEPKV